MPWIYLTLAIVSEVIATSSLKTVDGFTNWVPSLVVIIGYVFSFYFLSLSLNSIPLGVAYAIWSGVGIALVSLIGWVFYHQSLNLSGFIGITFIISGVLILILFLRSSPINQAYILLFTLNAQFVQ
jgi:Membrane transporters of cations and cationic drugs